MAMMWVLQQRFQKKLRLMPKNFQSILRYWSTRWDRNWVCACDHIETTASSQLHNSAPSWPSTLVVPTCVYYSRKASWMR
jgi:hypothetical protein